MLKSVRPSSVGTAAHFSKALGQAPILDIIKFVDKEKGSQLTKLLLQHADDLDYLQELMSSLGKNESVNPSLNAVVTAYSRRRFNGLFKSEGQSVELDTLLHQSTKNAKDDDNYTAQSSSRPSDRICFRFQQGICNWTNCSFSHRCSLCTASTHGALSCPRLQQSEHPHRSSTSRDWNGSSQSSRPPHPRFRRDRAQNRGVP